MQINNNMTSNNISLVEQKQNNLFEKLASGKKVNSALDGAAAQQIIDRLTSEVEGNRQSLNNVYDGISVAQVAEGGLGSINDDVNRIRELTLQSGNGVLSSGDRRAIQSEITQLQENISQTIEQTNFAGKPLLSENGSLDFQSGANANQSISINTQDIASQLGGLLSIDITAGTSVNEALEAADAAIETIGSARGDLGATQNRFESAARTLTQANVNTAEARSRIQDLDFAQAVSQQASNDVLGQAALTVQAQANQQEGQVLSLLS
ncbi:flagellin [Alteromonas mediterranea]|uniref:Flagellin n=1 Tax=Alteromonas mediterranea TaxID=314275 RepID=A0AAC8XIJ9_9ALTE|nr:flagellin [Alteromonas mediterranea]AFV84571.1 flagellin-like protein [Alteromonas mediterranea DE1]AGP96579.1 flagellin-like protein [Alteromonas mediterranea UM7]AGQ00914.1 flagellin-like protein [Alteromonas mediterranea UM4b]AMJ77746.1 flagellin [Alteromonas mediterranea]AMJ81891.1 flagellin [Alteromonas mediterranea]